MSRIYVRFNEEDMVKFSCIQKVMEKMHHSDKLLFEHLRMCYTLPEQVRKLPPKNSFSAEINDPSFR